MSVHFICMYACEPHECLVLTEASWASDPIELQLQMVMSHNMGTGNGRNPDLLEKQPVFLSAEPSFQPWVVCSYQLCCRVYSGFPSFIPHVLFLLWMPSHTSLSGFLRLLRLPLYPSTAVRAIGHIGCKTSVCWNCSNMFLIIRLNLGGKLQFSYFFIYFC